MDNLKDLLSRYAYNIDDEIELWEPIPHSETYAGWVYEGKPFIVDIKI